MTFADARVATPAGSVDGRPDGGEESSSGAQKRYRDEEWKLWSRQCTWSATEHGGRGSEHLVRGEEEAPGGRGCLDFKK